MLLKTSGRNRGRVVARLATIFGFVLLAHDAAAQQPPRKPPADSVAKRMPMDSMSDMPGMQHAHGMGGMMTGPLGISHERMGSGTSWMPDSSPMHAVHKT